jgi:RHS repeat-associated protein
MAKSVFNVSTGQYNLQVQERFIYDPYGKPTAHILLNIPYLFQGGRYDTITGLYNFRNRDHSPTLGRWMEEDPIGYSSNDKNLYGYVDDNPINSTDPKGLAGQVDPKCAEKCSQGYEKLYMICQQIADPDKRLACEARAFRWYQQCLDGCMKEPQATPTPVPDPVVVPVPIRVLSPKPVPLLQPTGCVPWYLIIPKSITDFWRWQLNPNQVPVS